MTFHKSSTCFIRIVYIFSITCEQIKQEIAAMQKEASQMNCRTVEQRKKILEDANKAYKLHLHNCATLTPSVMVTTAWRIHKAYPEEYEKDTKLIFGSTLDQWFIKK